jgi:hypothetical protein
MLIINCNLRRVINGKFFSRIHETTRQFEKGKEESSHSHSLTLLIMTAFKSRLRSRLWSSFTSRTCLTIEFWFFVRLSFSKLKKSHRRNPPSTTIFLCQQTDPWRVHPETAISCAQLHTERMMLDETREQQSGSGSPLEDVERRWSGNEKQSVPWSSLQISRST